LRGRGAADARRGSRGHGLAGGGAAGLRIKSARAERLSRQRGGGRWWAVGALGVRRGWSDVKVGRDYG